jgi:hypothetical protein
MTEKPSEAYLAGYFFGREGRRTERRFDAVVVELKAYAEGIVDGRRTARAAEDWRKAVEHELSLGLHWHDPLNIENPQVSDHGASIDPDLSRRTPRSARVKTQSAWPVQRSLLIAGPTSRLVGIPTFASSPAVGGDRLASSLQRIAGLNEPAIARTKSN